MCQDYSVLPQDLQQQLLQKGGGKYDLSAFYSLNLFKQKRGKLEGVVTIITT